MDKEIYKQWFGMAVRCFVSYMFGVLTARKLFPEEWAGLMLDSTVALLTGVLIQVLVLFWGWMKIRYNVFFARIARCVAPGTPMKEIANQVKAAHKFVTKI